MGEDWSKFQTCQTDSDCIYMSRMCAIGCGNIQEVSKEYP